MRGRRIWPTVVASVIALVGAMPAGADAAAPPAWALSAHAVPTNFAPGAAEQSLYSITVTDSGGSTTDGSPIEIAYELPPGIEFLRAELALPAERNGDSSGSRDFGPVACTPGPDGDRIRVACELSESMPANEQGLTAYGAAILYPSESRELFLYVSTPAGVSGPLTSEATVSGGGAAPRSFVAHNQASSQPAPSGLSFYRSELTDEAGQPVTQAGSHPYQYTTSFAVNTEPGTAGTPFVPAGGDLKNIEVALPPGLVGDPTAVARCPAQLFGESRRHEIKFREGAALHVNCPPSSIVGFARVAELEGKGGYSESSAPYVPVYNLVPPAGMPAQLGFTVATAPFLIDTRVRTGSDYGITAYLANLGEIKRVTATDLTLWGVPADPRHDRLRGDCLVESVHGHDRLSAGSCSAGAPAEPFLRMPTSCEGTLGIDFAFDTYTDPLSFASATSEVPTQAGCAALPFDPTISAVPDTTVSDSATGLKVDLHVPQHEGPEELATADLRDAVVRLPAGMALNPAGANGLVGCGPAQFGLTSAVGATPITTTADPASCPDASKVGSVVVDTPLLDHPIEGAVYVAEQGTNPFGSLVAVYIAAYDPLSGVVLKLAGHVELDPASGQVTARFDDNPQLPFEDLTVTFFGGSRAPLRTPTTCGTYATSASLTPWSQPASGPGSSPSNSFAVGTAPGGAPCAASEAAQPNQPGFAAGTTPNAAGAPSAFVLRLQREDGSQGVRGLNVDLPEGLLGRLAGIPYCSDAAIAAAGGKPGKAEQSSPSCPGSSRLGSVTVGAGSGPSPLYVGGTVYLAGPYKGAPLSLAIITPAVAGPFDLGTVVVRAALQVDPKTAEVRAVSDPIPTILQGIPLDVRSIAVDVDRPDFIRNPTSCAEKQVGGESISPAGSVAKLTQRFQVDGCPALGFKPALKLQLKGATGRTGHPALNAVVTYPKRGGYANIARAQVGLPRSEFLDQGNIGATCTQAELRTQACPKRSIYGYAKAWSPLLAQPLQGPVYLGVGFGHKLPDLVADLDGQIRILLNGRIDTTRQGGIRTTFEVVPDAPISRFVLHLRGGGKQGLLENSEDVCGKKRRASARFVAQNGRTSQLRPRLFYGCDKKPAKAGARLSGTRRAAP